jgi:hypothetical protein
MIGLKERYPDSFKSYDASMGGVGAIQLMGDPSLLEVVYRNLFGNALKYRYPHGKIAYVWSSEPTAIYSMSGTRGRQCTRIRLNPSLKNSTGYRTILPERNPGPALVCTIYGE